MAKKVLKILQTVQVGKSKASLFGSATLPVGSILSIDDDKFLKELTDETRKGGQLASVISDEMANQAKAAGAIVFPLVKADKA